jgi:hypothetical protein
VFCPKSQLHANGWASTQIRPKTIRHAFRTIWKISHIQYVRCRSKPFRHFSHCRTAYFDPR